MPVKRSRAGASSACAAAASLSPVKVMKTDADADTVEAARPKLLAVASPVNIGECADRSKIGGFLERCHYCNKRIAQDSDVFMYRFCCHMFCYCMSCSNGLDKQTVQGTSFSVFQQSLLIGSCF